MLERKNWSDDIFDLKKLCVNLILEKNSSITRLNAHKYLYLLLFFYFVFVSSFRISKMRLIIKWCEIYQNINVVKKKYV